MRFADAGSTKDFSDVTQRTTNNHDDGRACARVMVITQHNTTHTHTQHTHAQVGCLRPNGVPLRALSGGELRIIVSSL